MSNVNIIRAWKDEEYRQSLTAAERASLPANPAGMIELQAADLESVVGGSQARPPQSRRYSCTPRLCC